MKKIDVSDYMEQILDAYTREKMNVGIPAKILSVTDFGDRQTVDVVPVISRLFDTGDVLSFKENTIYGVPVIFPGGGGGLLSFPLKPGNTVWLSFCDRNMENWLLSEGSEEVIPEDSRSYNMSDAVCWPTIHTIVNNLKPNTEDVELKFAGSFVTLKPDQTVDIRNAAGKITLQANGNVVIDPSTDVTILGNLKVTGDIECDQTVTGTADVVGGGKSLKTHAHSGVTPGGGNSGPPV